MSEGTPFFSALQPHTPKKETTFPSFLSPSLGWAERARRRNSRPPSLSPLYHSPSSARPSCPAPGRSARRLPGSGPGRSQRPPGWTAGSWRRGRRPWRPSWLAARRRRRACYRRGTSWRAGRGGCGVEEEGERGVRGVRGEGERERRPRRGGSAPLRRESIHTGHCDSAPGSGFVLAFQSLPGTLHAVLKTIAGRDGPCGGQQGRAGRAERGAPDALASQPANKSLSLSPSLSRKNSRFHRLAAEERGRRGRGAAGGHGGGHGLFSGRECREA